MAQRGIKITLLCWAPYKTSTDWLTAHTASASWQRVDNAERPAACMPSDSQTAGMVSVQVPRREWTADRAMSATFCQLLVRHAARDRFSSCTQCLCCPLHVICDSLTYWWKTICCVSLGATLRVIILPSVSQHELVNQESYAKHRN